MNDKEQLAAMGEHLAEQQPMCMAKRIEELEAQVRVMAGLLREAKPYMDHGNGAGVKGYIQISKKIDAVLSGKLLALPVLPVVPKGWQLVPVEPTKAMREAFHEAHEEWESGDDWRPDSPDHQWSAMLSASPKPEAK